MKLSAALLASLAVASPLEVLSTNSKCSVTVCNHTPTTWLKVGAVKSDRMDDYTKIGSVKKNKCVTIDHDAPNNLLTVNRNTEVLGVYNQNTCGCTYDICGQQVVNKSDREIEAWMPANGLTRDLPEPMKIRPGEWKPVVGAQGQPIHIQDPESKTLFHTFYPQSCQERVVVTPEDCLGPDPSPATTTIPTSPPVGSRTDSPSAAVVTKVPTSLRSGDKCEPICGSLRGCYLFDFDSGADLPLLVNDPADVIASHASSVRCDVDGPIGLVEFVAPDGTTIHQETDAPFWMMGRNPRNGAVHHLPPLQMCQTMEFRVRGFMTPDDQNEACFDETFIIDSECTDSPSSSPSSIPTTEPTVSPTHAPTGTPTEEPTATPTESPTETPSAGPSALPSYSPSHSPTSSPSNGPTAKPTENPTGAPSGKPTMAPTAGPTSTPTKDPTAYPTENPSSSPSQHPTKSPTTTPTSTPTVAETKAPTETRTGDKLTLSPTAAPLPSPTSAPTDTPVTSCEAPHHPRMCYLWSSSLRYWDGVPEGTKIEVYTYYGKKFEFESTGLSSSTVPDVPFHQFFSKAFYVRFSNSCGSSYWTLCKNYTPSTYCITLLVDFAVYRRVSHHTCSVLSLLQLAWISTILGL